MVDLSLDFGDFASPSPYQLLKYNSLLINLLLLEFYRLFGLLCVRTHRWIQIAQHFLQDEFGTLLLLCKLFFLFLQFLIQITQLLVLLSLNHCQRRIIPRWANRIFSLALCEVAHHRARHLSVQVFQLFFYFPVFLVISEDCFVCSFVLYDFFQLFFGSSHLLIISVFNIAWEHLGLVFGDVLLDLWDTTTFLWVLVAFGGR